MQTELAGLLRARCPQQFWQAIMIVALLVFITNVSRGFADPQLIRCLMVLGYLLTLSAFAVGDSAVIGTTASVSRASDSLRSTVRKYLPADALLLALHGLVIVSLAFLCFGDSLAYIIFYAILTGANVIWLSVKLSQFCELTRDPGLPPVHRARVWECIGAMHRWMAINGVFLIMNCLLLTLKSSGRVDANVVDLSLAGLGVLRSVVDMAVCYEFYSRSLAGEFDPTRIAAAERSQSTAP